MNTILLSAVLVVVPDHWMKALALIETGDNPRSVGRHGEVGRYQLMPSFVRRGMSVDASSKAEAKARWDAFVRKHGRNPTPVEFYGQWHRPARATKLRPIELERARRFENLVKTTKP